MADYTTLECISRGSPNSAFIVKSNEDGKKYVLKKVECYDESDAGKAYFEQMELQNVKHPYVNDYKDFFVTYEKNESSVFINIIVEYFEKGNLETLIKGYQDRQAVIPEPTIQKMLGEMIEGVSCIHNEGLIHRNIKPRNIFIKESGALVIGDLAVSTIMGDVANCTRANPKKILFMAPESLSQTHTEKSDIFSLGCVILNLLTAYKYTDEEFVKLLTGIKEDQEGQELNILIEELSEHYSKSMIFIVRSWLRPTPMQRPCISELMNSKFIQECLTKTDSSQIDKRSRQTVTGATKKYNLDPNCRSNTYKVLEYIADTIDHEEHVAEGLAALADIVRDDETAHERIDQKARDLISLAMWDNIMSKDVQTHGCFVLSNLVVFAEPGDMLFTPSVITIIHKIMTTHKDEPEVQLAAVDLILALSADERASRTIVHLGGIHDILEAMKNSSYHATLQAVACMALWSLTIHEGNLQIAGKENAVKHVCTALKTHKVSPNVCEAGAAALVSLLLDDGCYDTFNELDCVGHLIAAISLHPKNAKVVHNCCKVLATVVEANEECAYRFLTSDNPDDENPTGLPTLMEAYRLHKDNSMVVEAIVRLLLELSKYDDINVEMQAALIGPLVLSEVHKRYKENRDIMGPVEEALDRLGSSVTPSKNQSWAPALALPPRPFKYAGEVRQSCHAMLRTWKKESQHSGIQTTKSYTSVNSAPSPKNLMRKKSSVGSKK